MITERFSSIFPEPKPIIGMLHVPALPGTPAHKLGMPVIIDHVLKEAAVLATAGVQALMLENMHDRPYLKRQVGPEITAAFASIAGRLRTEIDLPLGIQVLAGANREALSIAMATDLQFIRAEGFVFGHLADEGFMDSDAGELLRFRRRIGAEKVQIFTDIKKKHSSHAVTADVSLAETVAAADFFLSDGVIITGSATGHALDAADLEAMYADSRLPVFTGSGITADNLSTYWSNADAFIVGSSLKEDGRWSKPLDLSRINTLLSRRSSLLEND